MDDVYIHPLADVQARAVGPGTRIWQYVVVLPEAKIGADCNLCAHVFVENDVVVGDNVTVKNGVSLYDGVRLEDDVFVGPNATFTNDKFPRSGRRPAAFLRTVVRRGASIGANATLVAGIVVDTYAMIGAGSVVTRNVPPHELWLGNPARKYACVDRDGRIVELFRNDSLSESR